MNELTLILGQSDLTASARLYLAGVMVGSPISLTEVPGTGGLYLGSMPGLLGDGVYQIMFYVDDSLRASGSIEWINGSEVTLADTINNYVAPDNATITLIASYLNTELAEVLARVNLLATPLDVNTQMLDVLLVDLFSEVAAVPSANAPLAQKIAWLFMLARNKHFTTATSDQVFDDSGTVVIGTAPLTPTTTSLTKGEYA